MISTEVQKQNITWVQIRGVILPDHTPLGLTVANVCNNSTQEVSEPPEEPLSSTPLKDSQKVRCTELQFGP